MKAGLKSGKKIVIHNILASIAIVAWLYTGYNYGIFYGKYGSLLFGAVCAMVAKIKNRNPVAWFALGLWFVLAALIAICCLGRLYDRLCRYCHQRVSLDETTCPYCKKDIELLPKRKNDSEKILD
ncbi:MAG: hypothetical protein V1793_04430 [Pseudomonadota bacterium]